MSLKVNIKKAFDGFQLNVDFETGDDSLAILGPSGSGKSMTLKCIAGILTPDSGHIEVNGKTLFHSERRINIRPQSRNIGYLFQNYALFPHMTVEQNILCAIGGRSKKNSSKVQSIVTNLTEKFQLRGLEHRYPGQLSGGQQQRVALARILAYHPTVLLLDEPFSALDSFLKETLQMDMMELLHHYHGSAVMVTHNRDEAYQICRNTLIIDDGRSLELGETKGVFKHPRLLATARLTGCKNFSQARPVGEGLIEATDWGIQLQVKPPIPPNITHVGIRAHHFFPVSEDTHQIPNLFKVNLVKKVETPFEWNLLFHHNGNTTAEGLIWWKLAKKDGLVNTPNFLGVQPEDILLLSEH